MKPVVSGALVALGLAISALPLRAEESLPLPALEVTAPRVVTPTKQTHETVFTGTEVTRAGIEAQGGKTAASIYEALNVLPGIGVESVDPMGLSAEQKAVRVRGVRGFLGSMTVEGVPNYGGNPMGPRDYLYDTENFRGIAVYKGAVPADLGTSVGARGGAIELKPRWPEQETGIDLFQGFGSNDYSRTFVRLDSGSLPHSGTRLSLSTSYADAEKWKGEGDLGPRTNLNLMLAQPVGDADEIRLFVNINEVKQHLYRPLTYAETQALSDTCRQDYNDGLTGTRSVDINYFDYNRAHLRNQDVFAILPWTFDSGLHLSFKPYYSEEDSTIFQGVSSQGGLIQQRLRDIQRYGLLSEAVWPTSLATVSLGYLFESSDMQITTRNYVPGSLAFAGHGIYTENDGNGYTHSPYLKLAGSAGPLNWQAGIKYFYYDEPGSKGYTSPAPSFELVHATDLDRGAKTHDAWLPSVGLSWDISDDLQTYANYGRSQIRPYSYVPLINLYNQNRATFLAAGVTLDDLFNGYAMEISDSFELGLRHSATWFEIRPTAFYARHKHLLTTVHDPRVNLNYAQNVGEATGYGLELETQVFVADGWALFFNPTYTSLTYDDDLTYQGNTLASKGRQLVDTPEWSVKSGVIFRHGGWEVVPSLRYLGPRYGDVEHQEKVDSQVVADLRIAYTCKTVPFAKALTASLDLYNLFGAQAIALINASDDSRAGSTSYYAGPPFTAMFQLAAHF